MAGTRNYQSIGEVLVSVKTEFPDITISKIRFLEAEGLIEPERTPSGYRKFYVDDVDRLRSILRMQRDEYLPLKVIKERLLKQDVDDEERSTRTASRSRAPSDDGATAYRRGGDRRGAHRPADVDRGDVGRHRASTATGSRSWSRSASSARTGRTARKYYDGDDYIMLSIVKDFFRFGVEPRHLTMYKHFDGTRGRRSSRRSWRRRCARRTPTRDARHRRALADLAVTSRKFKQALLRTNLRDNLQSA